ncbi:hypothetical protein [Bacillus albus]|nr:hypothetical protein [Bacillus albus]
MTVNAPNLSKERTEQLAKNVVDNMKKGLNKYYCRRCHELG